LTSHNPDRDNRPGACLRDPAEEEPGRPASPSTWPVLETGLYAGGGRAARTTWPFGARRHHGQPAPGGPRIAWMRPRREPRLIVHPSRRPVGGGSEPAAPTGLRSSAATGSRAACSASAVHGRVGDLAPARGKVAEPINPPRDPRILRASPAAVAPAPPRERWRRAGWILEWVETHGRSGSAACRNAAPTTDLQMDQGLEGTGSGWQHPNQDGRPVLVAPGRSSAVATSPGHRLPDSSQAPGLVRGRCERDGVSRPARRPEPPRAARG
jgi:hypothetical protein